MTLLPTFSSACELASRLPDMMAAFMDIERKLTRNFREDSLSDLLIACLLQLPGNDVVVLTPPEHRTGSDFDLVLVAPFRKSIFQYRIQAKRLLPNDNNWRASAYRELAHKHNSGSQVQTLCHPSKLKGPIPTVPLYAFYNPASVATQASVDGIALADAFDIQNVVMTALSTKPRPRFKQLQNLQSFFFPLSTILCPSSGSGRGVATPEESRKNYAEARNARRAPASDGTENATVPDVGHVVPTEIGRALAERDTRIRRAPVKRPQVIIDVGE